MTADTGPARTGLSGIVQELVRFGSSSLVMLGVKLGLMQVALLVLTEIPAYAVVQVALFFLSYALHTRFSFGTRFSRRSLWRYFQTIAVFQGLDWLIFTVVFTRYQIHSTYVILMGTAFVFVLRFVFVRRSLK